MALKYLKPRSFLAQVVLLRPCSRFRTPNKEAIAFRKFYFEVNDKTAPDSFELLWCGIIARRACFDALLTQSFSIVVTLTIQVVSERRNQCCLLSRLSKELHQDASS
jgi:hypothetical protein